MREAPKGQEFASKWWRVHFTKRTSKKKIQHDPSFSVSALMTLSKGVNSSGLQVQSVVARVNFPHEGTRGLISNSPGTVEKLCSFFFKRPTKQSPRLVSPTPPSGCQAQGVKVSKMKYDNKCNKVNNNAIK
jgi:hypothetical protein